MLDYPQRPLPPALAGHDALFLDVDGTLVAFADHPDAVVPAAGLPQLLADVARRLQGALALISGRPVAQLDRLLAPLRLPAAGLHGAQLRPDPDMQIPAADTAQWLHDLHGRAMQLAHRHPGMLVEHKGSGLALHWRTAPDAASDIRAFAEAQLGQLPGVRLQPGNQVIEFVPAAHDKGTAMEALMVMAPFNGRRPVFVGDDLTDEAGFSAALRAGGYGVLVGARSDSRACYALADVASVHRWLRGTPP